MEGRRLPQSGEVWIGLRCQGCDKPILFINDPSKGTAQLPGNPARKVAVTCHHCGLKIKYAMRQLQRFSIGYA
ncbi:MAG: hypothetical protein ACREQ3_14930 [Candidatus Binatia bacterium]